MSQARIASNGNPNSAQHISKLGGEGFKKKYKTKSSISNLINPKKHKAHHASAWN